MTPTDKEIEQYNKDVCQYYNDKWGPNHILETFDYKKAKKVLLTVDAIKMHFLQLKKVYVCHTSSSAGLLYSLRNTFECEIVVLTDHPLFERLVDYYNATLGNISHKKINCVFDNVFEHTVDADLVIFPDMEYYLPMRFKTPHTSKMICCTYMIDDHTPTSYQVIAMSDEEVENLFGFKRDASFYKAEIKGYDFCYCGLGIL